MSNGQSCHPFQLLETSIRGLIVGILLVCIIVLVAFSSSRLKITEVVMLRDVTDSLIFQARTDAISHLFQPGESKWNGAVFRFVDMSDVSFITEEAYLHTSIYLEEDIAGPARFRRVMSVASPRS